MLNTVILMGRLTTDPEMRNTDSDIAVVNFCVAVDRNYVPEGEERKADFINVVAWRKTAEFVTKHFHKGDSLVVQGALQVWKYEDSDGNTRSAAEVVAEQIHFCDSKKKSESPGDSE